MSNNIISSTKNMRIQDRFASIQNTTRRSIGLDIALHIKRLELVDDVLPC
ncbi:MAG: hypothetical protein QXS45_06710 [Sulfolobales archaeon]